MCPHPTNMAQNYPDRCRFLVDQTHEIKKMSTVIYFRNNVHVQKC